MQFEYLADHPELVPQVIRWWHTVWADRMGTDVDGLERQLRASLNKDKLPLHILATVDGAAVGTAALKMQELADLYPQRQFWLGSVFVTAGYRGEKMATALTMKIEELAVARSIPHLHLQTVALDGGLYAKLGWEPIEQFSYRGEQTLLMCKSL